MRVITTGVAVGAAKEGSADAPSNAVIHTHALFVDDVAVHRGRHVGAPSPCRCSTSASVFTRTVVDKIPIVTRASRVLRKKLDSNDGLLGANHEFRRRSPRLHRDEPSGNIWAGMPASLEIGGCLPSLVDDVAAGRGRHVRLHHQAGAAHYRVYSSEQQWTKIPMRGRVSRALRKKLDSKNDLLGANQEFRRPSSRLLRDELGGSVWTGMPASHENGGCLPS